MAEARPTRHYATLDGLRGIAAIAVVIFHARNLFQPFQPESAYLAVDFFFVLSGFVIAHAYDNRLGHSMTGVGFFRARVIRLFPLYLAGTAIAAASVAAAVFVLHDAAQWTARAALVSIGLAIVMLPQPFTASLFPLNDASWSLFFEFLANGAYATRIWQGGRLIWLVPGCAAIGLMAEALVFGSLDNGSIWTEPQWSIFVWAGFRVAYSFPAGLLLYRFRNALPVPRAPVGILALGLGTLLWLNPSGIWRPAFDLGFVLVISPALVLIGCRSEPAAPYQAVLCKFLGSISYPIYVLHRPIMNVVDGALRRLPNTLTGPEQLPVIGMLLLCALIAISHAANRMDLFVRRHWLAPGRPVTHHSPDPRPQR